MIIQVLSEHQRRGYVSKLHHGAAAPFFAGVNLAVRREAIADIGPFDDEMRFSEDVDFCIRALDTRWELYFEPDARVEHLNRTTVGALARQWWNYGVSHAALFAKHNGYAVEVFAASARARGGRLFTPLFFRRARPPLRACIFLSCFSLLHFALGAAALVGVAGLPALTWAALAVALVAGVGYFAPDLGGDGSLRERLSCAGLRYLVNLCLVSGGLVGGVRKRFLYVYATVWHHPSPSSASAAGDVAQPWDDARGPRPPTH